MAILLLSNVNRSASMDCTKVLLFPLHKVIERDLGAIRAGEKRARKGAGTERRAASHPFASLLLQPTVGMLQPWEVHKAKL